MIKGLAQFAEQERKLSKALEPHIKAYREFNKKHQYIVQELTKTAKVFEEALSPLRETQKQWIKLVERLNGNTTSENEAKTKVKLIRYDEGKVIFKLTSKEISKENSHHLLLVIALLDKSDEKGFMSYKDIEQHFRANDLAAINDNKKSRKRILDAKKAVFRFLGIPEKYEGKELIEVVEKKGLKMYNPSVEA